jgi:hypothetical protein
MRAIRTSGLMSGDGKRGGASASVLAPILDSTKWAASRRCQFPKTPFLVHNWHRLDFCNADHQANSEGAQERNKLLAFFAAQC